MCCLGKRLCFSDEGLRQQSDFWVQIQVQRVSHLFSELSETPPRLDDAKYTILAHITVDFGMRGGLRMLGLIGLVLGVSLRQGALSS